MDFDGSAPSRSRRSSASGGGSVEGVPPCPLCGSETAGLTTGWLYEHEAPQGLFCTVCGGLVVSLR